MLSSLDATLGVHLNALTLRARRAELLASNLANADTPNYKARDFDFKGALAAAQAKTQPVTLSASHPAHIGGGTMAIGVAQPTVLYRIPLSPAFDGNTVDSHVEQGLFAQNAVRYQTSARLLGMKVRGVLLALKGE